MLRITTLLMMLTCLALPGFAEDDAMRVAPRPLASALHAMKAGRWEKAATLAARDGQAAVDLIEWHRLRAGQGTAQEVLDFLKRNGDWPGLDFLRKKSEAVMADADIDDILAFYADAAPQTGTGMLNYAQALKAKGQVGEAEANLVMAWHTMDLSTQEHNRFIAEHAKLLKPHHQARLDMALWRGLKDVEQMLPLVSKDQQKLAETRGMIKNGRQGLDAWIAKLPKAVQNDPGIAYEKFNLHIKRNKADKAIALILKQSRIKEGLGEPHRWAGWRRSFARTQMRQGNAQVAYDLASVHQLGEGAAYADLEWLSGYLALTYLDAPDLAVDHFKRFQAAVFTPISKGRAGYWLGRAHEARGYPGAAQAAYQEGAKHQTSFYGLLAAERAGIPLAPALAGKEKFPHWREAAFAQSGVYQAGVLALAMGQLNLAERFFLQLADGQDYTTLGQIGAMLADLGQPHLQVMLGKAAARRGIVLHAPYYALHPMTQEKLPVPMEMALAIARRESEFDFTVASGAGAQGLMQLMPGTANDVARDLGLQHDRAQVLRDWRYNARLGSTYLAQLGERFDGNVIMVAAGYNAGPGRPLRWMDQFGDPRTGARDVVDWIEHIPFRETRNYVMRVAESLPIYRARLGLEALPVPFSEELIGGSVGPLAKLE